MYSIGAFFVGAQVVSALKQTGAFEVYIDDELKYSKLESGQQITGHHLKAIFEDLGL